MNEVAGSAKTASDILKWLGWLVILVGGIAGAAALWFGFTAEEPWIYGGVLVEEDWESIGIGFLSAAWIAVYTGVVWALIQAVRAVIWYVLRKASA
jgi:hypothetical protein